jgi:two-component system chemotaxis response regulator CheY
MQHYLNSLFILLVEPSMPQKKIVINQLDDLGIEHYMTAETGEEALQIIDTEQPDLVISAMFLQDMDGTDLVLDMRANPLTQDIPFMLISTVTSRAELEPIKQAGATAVLPKPFEVADLKRAIMTTMDWENPEVIKLDHKDSSALRILLVDDSLMARHMIIRTLNKMGIQDISEAEDGREALTFIDKQEFDLIITDYNMPEMDGYELLKYIRHESNHRDIPVLMVTTEGDEGKLEAIQHEGISAIVDKPFDIVSVKRLIESVFS